jgi:PTH1 family peptidyl-tRNA hydrolase
MNAMAPKQNLNKTIILALGNPGAEFENTYHNAGLLALPSFISALTGSGPEELDWKTYRHLFEYTSPLPSAASSQSPASSYQFAHSLVFMNDSGRAAAAALRKFGVAPEDLIVLQDESDLALGQFKITFDRSSGGHKGAQSIIDHLKTQAFTRVRFGVRPKAERRRRKAGDFILAKITPTARKALEAAFEKAAEELEEKLSRPGLHKF